LLARGRSEVDASSVACLPRFPLDAPAVPTITCHGEFLDDTLGREFRKFCRGVVGGHAGEPPDLARRQAVRKGRKDGENELCDVRLLRARSQGNASKPTQANGEE
jgi:hypothetical protein